MQALFLRVYNKILPLEKFPMGSEARKNKAEICAERVFRLFVYLASTICGYLILKESQYLHVYLTGDFSEPQYYNNYPCTDVPAQMDSYYLVVLSYHFFETVYTLGWHSNRHDFSENILHHIVTIVLIGYSYYLNMLALGTVTIFVTDLTDIFVALFKLTVDIHNTL